MDFSFTAEDLAFGRRLADWLATAGPPGWGDKHPYGTPGWLQVQHDWDRTLYQGGWAGAFWPAEHGGLGLTETQRIIFAALCASAGAPDGLGKIGKPPV